MPRAGLTPRKPWSWASLTASFLIPPAGQGEETQEQDKPEAIMFSRMAVTNSLLSKLIPPKPEKKTPIDQLDKRLELLK